MRRSSTEYPFTCVTCEVEINWERGLSCRPSVLLLRLRGRRAVQLFL